MKFLGKDPNIIDAYYTATAEGAITAGKPVIVETDGDVAQVASSSSVLSTPSLGTSAEFTGNTGGATPIETVYDANADKFLIFYQERDTGTYYGRAKVATVSGDSVSFGAASANLAAGAGNGRGMCIFLSGSYDSSAQKILMVFRNSSNSNYSTAQVATISGTTVSFGTSAIFYSNSSLYHRVVYDANAGKHLIVYLNTSQQAVGIVATISGTNVSFGSPTALSAGATRSEHFGLAYDSNAQKSLLVYGDSNNSNYGTGQVCTISGTEVSAGTAAVFNSADTQFSEANYQTTAQKHAVLYADAGGDDYGEGCVATISGTDVTFGSATAFWTAVGSGSSPQDMGVTYDSSADRTIFAFQNDGGTVTRAVMMATISGTSISFSSSVEFVSDSASGVSARIAYGSGVDRSLLVYRDTTDGNAGDARTVKASTTSTNLTSENYIGIAADTYADNEDSTIGIVGCIDRNQTSLTAGQQYFVQTDGTLSTTAGDPSVLAGTAISATELVVKE
tara:strand:- start:43 stop:1560 length:1518 start_codon:yes stop_codon:yes gene_type:complete